MKCVGWLSILLVLGLGCAQENSSSMRQEALTAARAILANSFIKSDAIKNMEKSGCSPKAERLYAGKPFLIRSLIHPTEQDLQRLGQRIYKARKQEPDFFGRTRDFIGLALANHQDTYEVPIYDRSCGYLFHTRLRDNSSAPLKAGGFRPLPVQEAQHRLNAVEPPELIWFLMSLTPLRDGYMWVSGSKAIEAFGEHLTYRIIDRTGQPLSPLETELRPLIFRESFVTTFGEPSAYWYFQLPVRLEPLPTKP